MNSWIKGSYKEEEVDLRAHITMLKYKHTQGKYNIFEAFDEVPVVIFSDQHELLNYAKFFDKSIFLLRFLKEDDHKHSYEVQVNGESVRVLTVAQVHILIAGHKGEPRTLYRNRYGFLTVE